MDSGNELFGLHCPCGHASSTFPLSENDSFNMINTLNFYGYTAQLYIFIVIESTNF